MAARKRMTEEEYVAVVDENAPEAANKLVDSAPEVDQQPDTSGVVESGQVSEAPAAEDSRFPTVTGTGDGYRPSGMNLQGGKGRKHRFPTVTGTERGRG